jgi:NAD(P)-dependent dehydrogenase (short-subunit alcohol dehydrogenase family)
LFFRKTRHNSCPRHYLPKMLQRDWGRIVFTTPEEVAHMVVYVWSPQASATTGAALRVDGGVVRSIG